VRNKSETEQARERGIDQSDWGSLELSGEKGRAVSADEGRKSVGGEGRMIRDENRMCLTLRSQIGRLVIESALEIRRVDETGGASSGGGFVNCRRWSAVPLLDLSKVQRHRGDDTRPPRCRPQWRRQRGYYSGANCCVGSEEGESGRDLEF
jgi:hypothetical protein